MAMDSTPSSRNSVGPNKGMDESYGMEPNDDIESYISLSRVSHQPSLMYEVRKRARRYLSSEWSEYPRTLLTDSPTLAAKAAVSTSDFGNSQEPQRCVTPRRHISLCAVIFWAGIVVIMVVCGLAVLELEAGEIETGFLDAAPLARDNTPTIDTSSEVAHAVAKAVLFQQGASGVAVQTLDEFKFHASNTDAGPLELQQCDPQQAGGRSSVACTLHVHALSVHLDGQTQPSTVLVLSPVSTGAGVETYSEPSGLVRQIRLGILAGLAALVAGLLFVVHHLVLRPLRRLSCLMGQLGNLDLHCSSGELRKLRCGCRSRIWEVSTMQDALDRVMHALETFGRFIPLTVVRNIVHGDERSMRLHVSACDVTIMFSDIQEFTTLCEKLSPRDLLFIITRYLSVMTRIVEMYDGIVAEVLGDGLLVFWNTPDEVVDHAAKACSAALAQQHALALLNTQFATMGLPQLAMRVGLHTGPVLSGTIGSERRMKFGCMGDSVNLASRLEGLCKYYGVGVICSEATRDALPAEYGFFLRKLDLVQVKGKSESTSVFELIGKRQASSAGTASSSNGGAPATAMDLMDADGGCTATADPVMEDGGTGAAPQLGLSATAVASKGARVSTQGSLGDTSSPVVEGLQPEGPEGPSPEAFESNRLLCAEWYEKALDAYQNGQFLVARDLALGLMQVNPNDVTAARLFEKANRYISPETGEIAGLSDAELEAWTGVTPMEK
eukprot:CAMPEP_0179149512 /NCGR_PEP_ID=MMETSP0796-20121207/72436_1 /TAXON_ID=73915 /ORGANISM="Pyrodinium bahamense, Strain pbaha01" /LENGTH=723 /DNA_ID=CAMNT_0020850361 /DNA_START=56 /DNA_END=2227 /DNA_ORIENTATION=+